MKKKPKDSRKVIKNFIKKINSKMNYYQKMYEAGDDLLSILSTKYYDKKCVWKDVKDVKLKDGEIYIIKRNIRGYFSSQTYLSFWSEHGWYGVQSWCIDFPSIFVTNKDSLSILVSVEEKEVPIRKRCKEINDSDRRCNLPAGHPGKCIGFSSFGPISWYHGGYKNEK